MCNFHIHFKFQSYFLLYEFVNVRFEEKIILILRATCHAVRVEYYQKSSQCCVCRYILTFFLSLWGPEKFHEKRKLHRLWPSHWETLNICHRTKVKKFKTIEKKLKTKIFYSRRHSCAQPYELI